MRDEPVVHGVRLNALYRHYRTENIYTPIAVIKNTSTGVSDELMVLYYSFPSRELFTRKLSEWGEPVGGGKLRFRLLAEEDPR